MSSMKLKVILGETTNVYIYVHMFYDAIWKKDLEHPLAELCQLSTSINIRYMQRQSQIRDVVQLKPDFSSSRKTDSLFETHFFYFCFQQCFSLYRCLHKHSSNMPLSQVALTPMEMLKLFLGNWMTFEWSFSHLELRLDKSNYQQNFCNSRLYSIYIN